MTQDLVAAAGRIARREVSSVELVQASLAGIEQQQPKLNAFTRVDADAALAAAEAADLKVAAGQPLGPLHGVPLAHKDMFYRAGRPSSCGSAFRRDWRPAETATVLERLDAAGAIDLGTLNMSEWAMGPTGHNIHFGPARNPHDPGHVTGGSSSGSGSATAAGLCFGALGSDTGGSIRLPAHFCGLVGIKPSWGLVSRHAAMPLSWSLDAIGPLARTTRDVARLLGVIAGFDPRDRLSRNHPVPDYEALLERPVRGIRLGLGLVLEGRAARDADPAYLALLEAAAQKLARAGVEIVPLPCPPLDRLNSLMSAVLKPEAARLHGRLMREQPQAFSPQVLSRLEGGLFVPATRYLEALDLRAIELRRFHETVFTRCDALLMPVANGPAPTLEEADIQDPALVPAFIDGLTGRTRWVNYLGLPALSTPCGKVRGLPVGAQLIGRPFDDQLLLRLSHQLETAA
jgi:aspartyl-tRNA(Asn)/glutamyl-tRNA(Gln) amidotransferase subunit A